MNSKDLLSNIKLVKLPQGHFVYDANINRVEAISSSAYRLVDAMWHSGGDLRHPSVNHMAKSEVRRTRAEIRQLKSKGLLREPVVRSVSYDTKCLRYLYETAQNRLMLEITESCNLRCAYCPFTETEATPQKTAVALNTRPHGRKQMTLATAIAGIDYFLAHASHHLGLNVPPSISFYGGEPLLNFHVLKGAIQHTENAWKYRDDIRWNIVTNGTLLSPEVWTFCKAHHVRVTVSIDGNRKLHDRYRKTADNKGTFDIIEKNLSYCRRTFPMYYREYVHFNIGISPPADYEQIREAMSRNGATVSAENFWSPIHIQTGDSPRFKPVHSEQVSRSVLPTFRDEYARLMTMRQSAHKAVDTSFLACLVGPSMTKFSDRMKEQRPMPEHVKTVPPCVPGLTKLMVRCNGDLQICEKCSYDKVSKIGDISKGVQLPRVLEITRTLERLKSRHCVGCWAFRHCTVCFAALRVTDNGEIDLNAWKRQCEAIKGTVLDELRTYCSLMARYPNYRDNLAP